MTQRHFEILAKYEEKFLKAKSNYVRFSPRELDEVFAVSQEMYGVRITPAQRNCASCVISALKKLADAYFTAKKQYAVATDITASVNKEPDVVMNIRESIEQAAEAAACVAEVVAKVKKRDRKKKTQPAEK